MHLKHQIKHHLAILCLVTILPSTAAFAYEEDELAVVEIQSLTDFASTKKEASNSNKLIMLEMSASYCGYCLTLEEEIIKPMLRSGDYKDNVLIHQLKIDDTYVLNDTDGKQLTPSELASKYNVKITPTLLFLDGKGNEVREKIAGVYLLDFFATYIDDAIDQGLKVIRN